MRGELGRAILVARAKRLEPSAVQRAALRFAENHSISTCAVRTSEPFEIDGCDASLRFDGAEIYVERDGLVNALRGGAHSSRG